MAAKAPLFVTIVALVLALCTVTTSVDIPNDPSVDSKTGSTVVLSGTLGTGPVEQYKCYQDGTPILTLDSTALTYQFTITGLTALTTYKFTIKAVHTGVESGPTNETSVTTTAATVPGSMDQPTFPVVFGSKLTVAWTEPPDQGGDPTTQYELYMDGTLLYTGPDKTFEVTGLTAVTSYVFMVNSSNSVGWGPGGSAVSTSTLSILPRVYSIDPTEGFTDAKTAVKIYGEYLGPEASVTVVSVSGFTCTGTMEFISMTEIRCKAGPHIPSTGPVRVTTTQPGPATAALFTFKPPVPTVTSLSPGWGFFAPGVTTAISVIGHHFGTSSLDLVKVEVGPYECKDRVFVSTTLVKCVVGPATKTETSLVVKVSTTSLGTGPGTGPTFAFRDPFPFATGIEPTWTWVGRPSRVTITGRYFPTTLTDLGRVQISILDCTNAALLPTPNGTQIACDLPAPSVSLQAPIQVESKTLGQGDISFIRFEARSAIPTIEVFEPVKGWTIGGTTVTFTGEFLGSSVEDIKKIEIADKDCTPTAKWISATKISCVSPPGDLPGQVRVTTVENGAGPQPATKFQFEPPKPTVRSFEPTRGTPLGGTRIEIVGEFFGHNATDLLAIKLSGKRCSLTSWVSATRVICIAPRGSAGAKGRITVTTRSLRQGPVSNLIFQYDFLLPFVSSIIPNGGPMLGGQKVVLTGSHLNRVAPPGDKALILLAGIACKWIPLDEVYIQNVTTKCGTDGCQAMCETGPAPSRRSGPALLTDVDGATGDASAATYQYWAAVPTITAVTPPQITSEPGEKVILHGTDFAPFVGVPADAYLADLSCNQTTVLSNTSLSCITRGATNVTEGTSVQAKAKIENQWTASPFTVSYGLLCNPRCAGNSRCVDANALDTSVVCTKPPCGCKCRHGFVPEGACDKDAISISQITSTRTRETVLDPEKSTPATFTATLGTQPDARVLVAAKSSNEQEAIVEPSSYTFTSFDWSTVKTFTVFGQADSIRDGTTKYRVDINAVSDDGRFKDVDLPIPGFDMSNFDSDPTIVDMEPKVSPLTGARVRIRVRDLDPTEFQVRVFNLTISQKNVTVIPITASGERVVASRTGPRLLQTVAIEYWLEFVLPPVDFVGYMDISVTNTFGTRSDPGVYKNVLFYTDRCPQAGQWATSETDEFECVDCPPGGVCPGGNRILPAQGYWNRGEDSGFVFQCTPTIRCAGGIVPNEFRGACYKGYEGDFCGDCQFGYYPTYGVCEQCPGSLEMILYMSLGLTVWLLFGLSFFFTKDGTIDQLMLGFLGMQLINMVGQGASYEMADWLKHVFRVASFFAIDFKFYRIECWMDLNPMVEYAMHTFYWFVFPLTWLALLPLARHCYRSRIMNDINFDGYLPFDFMGLRWYRGFCFWVILSIYPVAKLCFEYMACRKIFDKYYLISHLTTQCYTIKHIPVNVFACIFLIGMLAYLPWRLVLFLRENRYQFGDQESEFHHKWGFLYANFRPSVATWFGLVLITQMVFMSPVFTMLPLLVKHKTIYMAQFIWTCIVLGTMMFLTAFLWVYRSALQQATQLTFYVAALFGSTLMYLMKTEGIDSGLADILSYVFVALVGIGILLAFFVTPLSHQLSPLPLPASSGDRPLEDGKKKKKKDKKNKKVTLAEDLNQPLDIPDLAEDGDEIAHGGGDAEADVVSQFLQYPSYLMTSLVGGGDDDNAGNGYGGEGEDDDARSWLTGGDDDTVTSWIPNVFGGGAGEGDAAPPTNPDSVSLDFVETEDDASFQD